MQSARRSPTVVSLQNRANVHSSWAKTPDVEARTAPGLKVANDRLTERFTNEVDPERKLAPADRARRIEHARKAYFYDLAAKSAKARAARRTR
jgi:hypothetical protein